MTRPEQRRRSGFARPAGMAGLFILLATAIAAPALAQTLTVLHTFTGGEEGGAPYAGLTIDRAGNFYGTTSAGGEGGYGTVFKLSHAETGWILNTLYRFQGGNDGGYPYARVVFGPDGLLYGTTSDYASPAYMEPCSAFSRQPRHARPSAVPGRRRYFTALLPQAAMALILATAILPSMRKAISTAQPLTEEGMEGTALRITTAAWSSSSPDWAEAGRKACSTVSASRGMGDAFPRAASSSTAPVTCTAQPFFAERTAKAWCTS